MISFVEGNQKIEVNDLILFRVNFERGYFRCRIQRGQSFARWDVPGKPPLQLEGLVEGILCPNELHRVALFLARVFGNRGVLRITLDDRLEHAGRIGFRVV